MIKQDHASANMQNDVQIILLQSEIKSMKSKYCRKCTTILNDLSQYYCVCMSLKCGDTQVFFTSSSFILYLRSMLYIKLIFYVMFALRLYNPCFINSISTRFFWNKIFSLCSSNLSEENA